MAARKRSVPSKPRSKPATSTGGTGAGKPRKTKRKARRSLLPRSLDLQALICILSGLLLVVAYTQVPLKPDRLPPVPHGFPELAWFGLAFPAYWLLGFLAYGVPLALLAFAYLLYSRTRKDRRRKYLTRGGIVAMFAIFWMGALAGVAGRGGLWGGIGGRLFVGAFSLPLGWTAGPWVALVLLCAVTLHIFGIRPDYAGLGRKLGSAVRGLLRRKEATPASRSPEGATADTAGAAASAAGGAQLAAGAVAAKAARSSGLASTDTEEPEQPCFPEPRGRKPLPVTILPEPPPLSDKLSDLKQRLPEMAGQVTQVVEEISRVRLTPDLDASYVGLSTITLAFTKAEGQRRPVTDIGSSLADVGLALKRPGVRLVLGDSIRFEMGLQEDERVFVPIRPMLEENPSQSPIPSLMLGRSQAGTIFALDAEKAVHMLVAGATGGGKSVLMHTMIFSLVFRYPPDSVWLALADFKATEFNRYQGLGHLWRPVCCEENAFTDLVSDLTRELERRKKLMVADPTARLPFLYVFIDEFRGIDTSPLIDLFRLGRAFNMRFVLATQYPNRQTITREIKANLTTKVALLVNDSASSQLILGSSDATMLTGKGDCLVDSGDAELHRVQAAWVRDEKLGQASDLAALRSFLARPEPEPGQTCPDERTEQIDQPPQTGSSKQPGQPPQTE